MEHCTTRRQPAARCVPARAIDEVTSASDKHLVMRAKEKNMVSTVDAILSSARFMSLRTSRFIAFTATIRSHNTCRCSVSNRNLFASTRADDLGYEPRLMATQDWCPLTGSRFATCIPGKRTTHRMSSFAAIVADGFPLPGSCFA